MDRRTRGTLASPLSVPEDAPLELEGHCEVRIWGTTEGSDRKKRTSFEAMESGDPVLFLHEGSFVGSGRVGNTFESSEVGEWIWDALGSRFIYSITDCEDINDDYIEKMFEVESTTSIYSGILRMTDFVVKVPNLAVDMHIVAPAEDEDQVRRQMDRPTFQQVTDRAEHCSLQSLPFDEVREKHNLVNRVGPLRAVF
jgi:hypothetical protein